MVGAGAFFLLSGDDEDDSAAGDGGGSGPPSTLGDMEMPEVPELDTPPDASGAPEPPESDDEWDPDAEPEWGEPSGGDAAGGATAGEATAVPAGSESEDCRSSEPTCGELAASCQGGDMTACDTLWLRTRVGSAWEEYGATCGGRTAEWMSHDCEDTFG